VEDYEGLERVEQLERLNQFTGDLLIGQNTVNGLSASGESSGLRTGGEFFAIQAASLVRLHFPTLLP
jgi:hypothetical protein